MPTVISWNGPASLLTTRQQPFEPTCRRSPAVQAGSRPEPTNDQRKPTQRSLALGDDLVRKGPKWHEALGAIDPNERTEVLDMLGFEHQVVFSSLCAPLFGIADRSLRYAAYRAHNRAMAGFCANDKRLHGVALCDLDDPQHSLAELDFALELGLGPVWIPARAPGGVSPGHNRHDPFWARLAERKIPFVLHVGSGPLQIDDAWRNNGRAPPIRMPVAEVINSKDLMVVYQPAERFLVRADARRRARTSSARYAAAPSRWAPVGCPTCCVVSITRRTSGANRSPNCVR